MDTVCATLSKCISTRVSETKLRSLCQCYEIIMSCFTRQTDTPARQLSYNSAASIERQKAKTVLASRRLCPSDPSTRGSARGPRNRLALRALAMAPLYEILNTPLSLNPRTMYLLATIPYDRYSRVCNNLLRSSKVDHFRVI